MKKEGLTIDPLTIAQKSVEIALDKKCIEPRILDLRDISSICDYFVIFSGSSDRHVKAIVNALDVDMKKAGISKIRKETDEDYTWCIIDYGSVITHVFNEKTRAYYRLEKLWGDAPEVPL